MANVFASPARTSTSAFFGDGHVRYLRSVASDARREEVAQFLKRAAAWAAARDDLVAAAVVGSWARDSARGDSDVDVVLLTHEPTRYTNDDDWVAELAPGATLVNTDDWGAITERRMRLFSGLEVEVGVGLPSWANTEPVDPGTRRVVRDGIKALHDPHGLVAALSSAC